MTYRTALYFAAGLAVFMSAGPVLAGTSFAPVLPAMQFVEESEVPTRAKTPNLAACQFSVTKQPTGAKTCQAAENRDQKRQKLGLNK